MITFGDNTRKNAVYFSRMGAFCILLAVTITACESPDSRELESEEMADAGAQHGMTDAHGGARMMNVSITPTGEIVPTVPGGRTTFTVENDHAEDCQLTLIPQEGTDVTGRSTMGEEAMGEDGLGNETTPGASQGADDRPGAEAAQNPADAGVENGSDRAETPQTDANRAGATQGEMMGGQSNRVTRGQATTVTLDLEPGLYEVSCNDVEGTGQQGSDRQGSNLQGTNQLGENGERSPMFVMVTEETSFGGAMHDDQGTAQPESREPSDADNLGTDNQ